MRASSDSRAEPDILRAYHRFFLFLFFAFAVRFCAAAFDALVALAFRCSDVIFLARARSCDYRKPGFRCSGFFLQCDRSNWRRAAGNSASPQSPLWRILCPRRTLVSALDWSQCPAVESVPGKVSGAWVFKDTRMPVSIVFENPEDGMTVDEIIEQFDVTREQVAAVLEFAARSLEVPVPR